MANARQIKRRITAAGNISKITKAMEMVAASKMRKAQDQATAARPYARALQASLAKLSQGVSAEAHPMLFNHGHGKDVVVVIATDKGLCGSLNAQLMKATLRWFEQHPEGAMVAVGKKAVHFATLAGLSIHAQFTDLAEHVTTESILPLTELIADGFLDQGFRSVDVIYMDFINTLSQQVRSIQLLPLQPTDVFEAETATEPSEYIFEPSAKDILKELLPYYLENTVYQSFLEARASEHSARMVTMKNASENAGELVDELKLEFNKTRQASITSELLDITTASLTLN